MSRVTSQMVRNVSPGDLTVLLTGATGFLGSNLLPVLLEAGYKVVILKRSFSTTFRIQNHIDRVVYYNIDQVRLAEIFDRQHIDVILHCATDYGRKEVEPSQIIDANLTLPLSILHLLSKKKGTLFVNTDTILDKNVNSYSLSKKQFLEWFKSFSKDLVCVNISLEHFYGPDDDHTKFVTWVISQLISGVDKIDFTPGDQKRDFVYISDTVRAFLLILEAAIKFKSGYYEYQVGSGNLVSIKELAYLAKKLSKNSKTQLNFGALAYRENETMVSEVNLQPLKGLGWSPLVSLEKGLQEVILRERELLSKQVGGGQKGFNIGRSSIKGRNSSKTKCLITGGCGFLGSNLAKETLNRGYQLTIFDNLSRLGSEKNREWLQQ